MNMHTWISPQGTDDGAGTIAAPVKSLSSALAMTARGGRITALGPWVETNPLSITKSVVIDAGGWPVSIEVTTDNGINNTAPAGDIVELIGILTLGIGGSGLIGHNAIGGADLHLRNSPIIGFKNANGSGLGLSYMPPTGADGHIYVEDSPIRECSVGAKIMPVSTGSARGTFRRSHLTDNVVGFQAYGSGSSGHGVWIDLDDIEVGCNSSHGVVADCFSGSITVVRGHNVRSINNGGSAWRVGGEGGPAYGVLGGCTVWGNSIGLDIQPGGAIYSHANNEVNGNSGGDGAFTGVITLK